MVATTRERLLSTLHLAAVNRVIETEEKLYHFAVDTFRDRLTPGVQDARTLTELDQKLDHEKRRLARINDAMAAL